MCQISLLQRKEHLQKILFSNDSDDSDGALDIENLTIRDDLGDDEGDEEYIDEGDLVSEDGEEGDGDVEESEEYEVYEAQEIR